MNYITRLSRSIIWQALMIDAFLLSLYGLSLGLTGHQPSASAPEVLLILAILPIHWIHLYSMKRFCVEPAGVIADRFEKIMDGYFEASDTEPEKADPWEYQRKLMEISGQALPQKPVLSKGGALYGALIMEEVGETFEALSEVLCEAVEAGDSSLKPLALQFAVTSQYLKENALEIRGSLVLLADFELGLTEKWAVELLDGTTDVSVVNCGFALACGLPGASSYAEVVLSNISKMNPQTGVIDKTPDGKWIKGSQFFKPNLVKILYQHAEANGALIDQFFADSEEPAPAAVKFD